LGGPGLTRGAAWPDTQSGVGRAAAAGHPGHGAALALRHRPPPLGRKIHARKVWPACAARILDWVGDLPFLAVGLARRWLASRMLLKIVNLLMRWLFSLVALVFCGDRAKDAELLVLRHENAVLRRRVGRLRYEPSDRVWFTALARFIRSAENPS
jgi:hypothetical protein